MKNKKICFIIGHDFKGKRNIIEKDSGYIFEEFVLDFCRRCGKTLV